MRSLGYSGLSVVGYVLTMETIVVLKYSGAANQKIWRSASSLGK